MAHWLQAFPVLRASEGFIEYLKDYGVDNMNTLDTLEYDKVIEVARNMEYGPTKPIELNKYVGDISKMDLWDRSKILFFGKEHISRQYRELEM